MHGVDLLVTFNKYKVTDQKSATIAKAKLFALQMCETFLMKLLALTVWSFVLVIVMLQSGIPFYILIHEI